MREEGAGSAVGSHVSSEREPARRCRKGSFDEIDDPSTIGHQVQDDHQVPDLEEAKADTQSLLTQDYKPNDHPDRYPGHMPVFLVCLMASYSVASFTYIIPVSIEFAEYLGQTQFWAGFAISMACYFSGLLGPPYYLLVQKVGLKNGMLVCCGFFFVGLFLYILSCPVHSFGLLVVARCVVGIGGQLTMYWYSARAVGINRRTEVNQYINASLASGYSIGPYIASVFYSITKNHITPNDSKIGFEYDSLWWNRVTSPAWFILILVVVTALLLWFYLEEPEKETQEVLNEQVGGETPLRGIIKMSHTEKVAFGFNLCASFTLPIIISAWEVFSVNQATQTWGWAPEIAGVYVGTVFLFLVPACIIVARVASKLSDRDGQLYFTSLATVSFLFLWDWFPAQDGTGVIILYTVGSMLTLTGFQVARGFCWSLLSKQVPTHSKGVGNMLMFMFYIFGRGSGSLIADLYKTDAQSKTTDYSDKGFTAWSPQNTYAWS